MIRFSIPLTMKAYLNGFDVGMKVYQDKLSFPDKYTLGGYSEIKADIDGFIAESAVCEFFGTELPALTPKQNDAYDLSIHSFKVDVKKIGNPKLITVNKSQAERKKHLIDAFLFVTFSKAFEEVQISDYNQMFKIFLPVPEQAQVEFLGWITTENLLKKGKSHFWKDGEGNVTNEALKITEAKLKDVREWIDE